MLILNAVMEPVTSSFAAANAEEAGIAARDQRLWTTDVAAFSSQARGLVCGFVTEGIEVTTLLEINAAAC
jgi:hypothetical protein